jgi:hypothetical protein
MRALLLITLVACSDNSSGLSDAMLRDVGPLDSGGDPLDAKPNDAQHDAAQADADPADGDQADADPIDADPMDADLMDADPVDADPIDAEPMDAVPDAGFMCGTFGSGCASMPDCDPGQDCMMNVCYPPGRPECGGFVGALCPPTFPECIFYAGADFGPCFTAPEIMCICATPEGRAAFACP